MVIFIIICATTVVVSSPFKCPLFSISTISRHFWLLDYVVMDYQEVIFWHSPIFKWAIIVIELREWLRFIGNQDCNPMKGTRLIPIEPRADEILIVFNGEKNACRVPTTQEKPGK